MAEKLIVIPLLSCILCAVIFRITHKAVLEVVPLGQAVSAAVLGRRDSTLTVLTSAPVLLVPPHLAELTRSSLPLFQFLHHRHLARYEI